MTANKPIQIIDYRVDRWLNRKSNETLYGVSVKIKGEGGWIRVCNDNAAVIVQTERLAEKEIAEMKSQRDKDGFKLPPPPPSKRDGGLEVHRDPCEFCGATSDETCKRRV